MMAHTSAGVVRSAAILRGMRLLTLVVVSVLVACSGSANDRESGSRPTVAGGLRIEAVVGDLVGPTQMMAGPDGRLWVAQLNGGENEQQGQVLAIDLDSGEREVVVEGLDKPTGIAWLDGNLWIATRDALLRAEGDPPSEPTAVLDGLPNNGRSNGTLTPTPDGTLLYETSGRQRDGDVVEGSGILWELDPAEPDDPQPIATGLKNAYAHVFDDGALWITEVAEPIGGVTPPDELNTVEVRRDADYGWPACIGDRQPVESMGGDRERCADTVPPIVEFGPGATPTSVAVSPFADDELIVALWNAGQVVSVAADGSGDPQPLVEGLPHPQHLLADGDALLVSDHEQGVVYRVTDGA